MVCSSYKTMLRGRGRVYTVYESNTVVVGRGCTVSVLGKDRQGLQFL